MITMTETETPEKKMKFTLSNFIKTKDNAEFNEWNNYLDDIVWKYRIDTICSIKIGDSRIETWCLDGNLEQLFADFGIEVGKVIHAVKKFDYDEVTYEPIGLNYGDLIETVELHQNGETYLCDAYCVNNGCGAEYAFALFEIM